MYYLLKYNSLNSIVLVQEVKISSGKFTQTAPFSFENFYYEVFETLTEFQKTDRGVSTCFHHSGSIF